MSPEKFEDIWGKIIVPAIEDFLNNNEFYKLEYGLKNDEHEVLLDVKIKVHFSLRNADKLAWVFF